MASKDEEHFCNHWFTAETCKGMNAKGRHVGKRGVANRIRVEMVARAEAAA